MWSLGALPDGKFILILAFEYYKVFQRPMRHTQQAVATLATQASDYRIQQWLYRPDNVFKLKNLLGEIIADLEAKDVFNVDEAGLFYQCLPNLSFKGETCNDGELSKKRVALIIGANMNGTKKLPLLMIGKSGYFEMTA
ncbi:hypothetical protein TKK_0013312 [Trichogramma kaykai]